MSGDVVGIIMRGGEFSSADSKDASSVNSGAEKTSGLLRRITVSSSTLSLGNSVNTGGSSSTSGVPSFMQKRKISSS